MRCSFAEQRLLACVDLHHSTVDGRYLKGLSKTPNRLFSFAHISGNIILITRTAALSHSSEKEQYTYNKICNFSKSLIDAGMGSSGADLCHCHLMVTLIKGHRHNVIVRAPRMGYVIEYLQSIPQMMHTLKLLSSLSLIVK